MSDRDKLHALRNVYGTGGYSHLYRDGEAGMMDYDGNAFTMTRFRTYRQKRFTWRRVFLMLGEMVARGEY